MWEGYTGMQRLPIAQAAERLGISKTAMRRRVERRTVDAIKGDDGQWLVAVPDDATPGGTPTGVHRGTPSDTPAVEALTVQLAFLQAQLVEKDQQIRELHVMLQTTQRLIPATVPDAPHAAESPRAEASVVPGGAQREPEASWRRRLRRWMGWG